MLLLTIYKIVHLCRCIKFSYTKILNFIPECNTLDECFFRHQWWTSVQPEPTTIKVINLIRDDQISQYSIKTLPLTWLIPWVHKPFLQLWYCELYNTCLFRFYKIRKKSFTSTSLTRNIFCKNPQIFSFF